MRRITKDPHRDKIMSSNALSMLGAAYQEETLSLNSDDSKDSFDSSTMKTIQWNIDEVINYNLKNKVEGQKGSY